MADFIFSIFKVVGLQSLDLLSRLGYGGVFVFGALDRITISLIPTEVLLPVYGFLISAGKFKFWPTFWVISLGAVIGELFLFWISGKVGRGVVERWGKFFFVSKHDLSHLDALFKKHGAKIVFWGRFIPVARAIIAIPAGVSGMNRWQFVFYSFVGMLPFNLIFLVIGLKAGENFESFLQYFKLLEKIFYVLFVGAIIWYVYKHINKKHLTH